MIALLRTNGGAWAGAALVLVGAITALVSLTMDDADLPRGAGGAWARATFTGSRTGSEGEGAGTLVVSMSVRGEVAVSPGADERLLDLYESGDDGIAGSGRRQAGAREGLANSFPESLTSLAVYLASGLMLAAAALALAPRRLGPAWPFVGAGSLALLVVAVLLRQLTVGELGGWAASMNLAEHEVRATGLSGRPVLGAVVALAGALVGSLLGAGRASEAPDR